MARKMKDIDSEEEICEASRVFDEDGNGCSRPEALLHAMTNLREKRTDEEVHKMIREADKDGDGQVIYERNRTINFPEFLTVTARKMKDTDSEEDICEASRVFDEDGDASSSLTALMHAMTNWREKLTDEEVEEIIREADKDGDDQDDYHEGMLFGFDVGELSAFLNKILDSYGLDEDTRRKCIECVKMTQLLLSWHREYLHGKPPSFFSGSFFEVTTTDGLSSDVDILHVIPKTRVIDDISQWEPNRRVLTYMMDSTGCYKTFCKLYLLSFNKPEPLYLGKRVKVPRMHCVDENGLIWRLHDLELLHESRQTTEIHGPALSEPSNEIFAFDTDNVPCLMCDSFPREALNWKQRQTPETRSRIGGAIIDRATNCYLVGVGNKGSVSEHLEWRLSFSHIESELIHEWNSTLNKCYIMMKFIKKDLIEPEVLDLLCSYHFKTLLMWMKEEYDEAFFVETNLKQCLLACLRNLLSSVRSRSLPHYFVGGCNLFNNRISDDTRDRLVSVLENILSQWPTSLFQIKRRGLGDMLNTALYFGIQSLSPCYIKQQFQEHPPILSLEWYRKRPICYFCGTDISMKDKRPNEIFRSLQNLISRFKRTTWDYQDGSREFIEHILKDLLCRFGLSLVIQSEGMANKHAYSYRKSGFGFLRTYIKSCSFFTTLKIAEYLTVSEHYQWALKVLEMAEHKSDIQANLMNKSSVGSTGEGLFYKYHDAAVIRFVQNDISHIPRGLAYEFISVNFITNPHVTVDQDSLGDPVISVTCHFYLYYLQFLCFNALGLRAHRKVALDNMIWLNTRITPKFLRRVNHNIIGHCYSILGETQKAYREYRKALKIRSYQGMTSWHLAVLLRNRIQHVQNNKQ